MACVSSRPRIDAAASRVAIALSFWLQEDLTTAVLKRTHHTVKVFICFFVFVFKEIYCVLVIFWATQKRFLKNSSSDPLSTVARGSLHRPWTLRFFHSLPCGEEILCEGSRQARGEHFPVICVWRTRKALLWSGEWELRQPFHPLPAEEPWAPLCLL